MIRKLVYSETQEDFNKEFEEMSSDPTFLKYPNYSKHMNEILPGKDKWSIMFRIQGELCFISKQSNEKGTVEVVLVVNCAHHLHTLCLECLSNI